MARITILGGTGFAGAHIAAEAASRQHDVTVVSRNAPTRPIDAVAYVTASATETAGLASAVDGADVIVGSLSPRGDMAGRVRATYKALATLASEHDIRLFIIGGAGSLLVGEGGPRLVDGEFPEAYKAEALELAAVLDDLRAADASLDWTLVSPAASFGAHVEAGRTGEFRTGGDVLLTDETGASTISGPDLAIAVVDEIERPVHRGKRFTVAY